MVYLQRWHGWCHVKLLPSRSVLCTPYNHAPCHFKQNHIHKVNACLAVTRHLHFWQNDRDLLRATAVTRGWNGYQNKNQHRKLTLEKKFLQPRFEPATFQSRVRRSNHWAIPVPQSCWSRLAKWGWAIWSLLLGRRRATCMAKSERMGLPCSGPQEGSQYSDSSELSHVGWGWGRGWG